MESFKSSDYDLIIEACEKDSLPELLSVLGQDKDKAIIALDYLKETGNLSLLAKMVVIRAVGDDVVRILLALDDKHGEELDRVGRDGLAPLHIFASNPGLSHLIRVMAHDGANMDVMDNQHRTPLLLATESNLNEHVMMLINNGAVAFDIPDSSGWTPLHYACQNANPMIVSWLMQVNANVNPISKDGVMPIHVAISSYVISRQSPVSPSGQKWSPQAAKDCIGMLVKNGADMNYVCSYGFAARDFFPK